MKLLKGKNIVKVFNREGFLGGRLGSIKALKGINFEISKGEILGVVGESGSGKSTLAKIICGLEKPSCGHLIWARDLQESEKGKKAYPAQMVFQNPYGSLNPKLSIGYMLKEAIASGLKKRIRDITEKETRKILSDVGLEGINLSAYPHQFSGGQKQRLGIARALGLNPSLLVCDEPVSALDISVQAQILKLIMKINKERKLPVIFIAHDIEVVSIISSRIMVMKEGQVIEEGKASDIISNPSEIYTKNLIEAVPVNPYLNE